MTETERMISEGLKKTSSLYNHLRAETDNPRQALVCCCLMIAWLLAKNRNDGAPLEDTMDNAFDFIRYLANDANNFIPR